MFAYIDSGTVNKKINWWNQIIWSIKFYDVNDEIIGFARDTIKSLYNVDQYTDKYKANGAIPICALNTADVYELRLMPISICAFQVTNNLIINFPTTFEL